MKLEAINRYKVKWNNAWQSVLQYFVFACILFGIKLYLIGNYGNITPFWDQWDGEAALLYKPFLDGTLTLKDLVAPHNEHRIFTTRILSLGILSANNIWNPLLQMVINAGLHILMIVFSIYLLSYVTGKRHLPALLTFSLVLFGIPYGWENTLAGFQSQFYFVLLFSIASLWLTVVCEPLSFKWWGGIACALLAFLSLASGIFALGAAAFMGIIFYLSGLRKTNRQLIGIVILAAFFILGAYFTPSLPGHAMLKATSFDQFFSALKGIMGWPISSTFLAACLRNVPALLFTGWMLWKRPQVKDRRWLLFALVIWYGAQAASVAYGRGLVYYGSRYMDLFAIGILFNFACLLSIVRINFQKRRSLSIGGVFAWLAIVLFSLGNYGISDVPPEIASKHLTSLTQEKNTKSFVETGDTAYLTNKPRLDIPYPDPNRLAMILSLPEVRKILPSAIAANLVASSQISTPDNAFVVNGYFPTTPAKNKISWGSYNVQGDNALGKFIIKFDSQPGGTIKIPAAGYPLESGNKIEIEQNGQYNMIVLKENPKENWATAYARIEPGPFSLCLTDSSKTSWLAAGQPSFIGRFDRFTSRLLSHYYWFLLTGIIGTVFLIAQRGYNGHVDNNWEDNPNIFLKG